MPVKVTVDIEKLERRRQALLAQRSREERTWKEIDRYISPAHDKERETDPNIWDFTGPDGSRRLTASVCMSAVSPFFRWAKLAHPAGRDDHEVRETVEKIEDEAFDGFEDSDFYTEMPIFVQALIDKGSAFFVTEPVYDGDEYVGLDCTAIAPEEAVFTADRKWNVKEFWRDLSWTPSQVVDFCESRNVAPPKDILERYGNGDDTAIEIVFCIFERPDILRAIRRDPDYNPLAPVVPERRPWGSVYYRKDTLEALAPEGGYYERPVVYGIFEPKARSKWGVGLGHIALPTVKYVNALLELVRGAGEKQIDPPWMTDERNITSAEIDYSPGAINFVRDPERMKPMISGGRVDVSEQMVADTRAQIRQLYHVDDLQLKDSPAMTATEAQIRYELMNRVLGSFLARFQTSVLGPVMRSHLGNLYRAGRLPPIPEKMRRGIFGIQYQGPLARSQRTDEVAAIERFAAQVAGLAQYFPEALAVIDVEKALRNMAQRLGIPAECMRSPEEVRKKVAEMQAAQAQMQRANSARKEAAAMKDMAAAQRMLPAAPIAFPGSPALAPSGVPA